MSNEQPNEDGHPNVATEINKNNKGLQIFNNFKSGVFRLLGILNAKDLDRYVASYHMYKEIDEEFQIAIKNDLQHEVYSALEKTADKINVIILKGILIEFNTQMKDEDEADIDKKLEIIEKSTVKILGQEFWNRVQSQIETEKINNPINFGLNFDSIMRESILIVGKEKILEILHNSL